MNCKGKLPKPQKACPNSAYSHFEREINFQPAIDDNSLRGARWHIYNIDKPPKHNQQHARNVFNILVGLSLSNLFSFSIFLSLARTVHHSHPFGFVHA